MDKTETITMKEYLIQKGITFKETNGELITKCVFCEKENHLYFSAETGQYQCKVCGEEGNIFTLAKHFGDDLRNIITNYHYNNMENNKSPFDSTLTEKCHNALPQEIRVYLNNRGISDEIIEKNKLGWGNFYGRDWITIPAKDSSGNYTFLKLRKNPLDKDNRESSKYMFYPKGRSAVLYGAEHLKNSERITICEGEFDQMILEKHGIAAVTSTAGAGTFKKEWVKHFANCQEIYICFDVDKAGEVGADRTGKLLSTIGAKIFKVTLPQELGESGDITDYFAKGFTKEDLFSRYSELCTFDMQICTTGRKANRSIEMIRILKSFEIEIFLNQLKEPCVAINKSGNKVMRINSDDFEIWAIGECFRKGEVFGSEALKNAKMALLAEAHATGKQYNLSVRSACDEEGNFWYDLGEKAVKITPQGWEIVNHIPILFQRFKHQEQQVMPRQGAALDSLFELFNIKCPEDVILLKVWIVTCFIPKLSHPVLVMFGEHGSAKSTTFKILKSLIDPSAIDTLAPIKSSQEFIQIVSHHWLSCFDNFSSVKDDLSDNICRVSTGASYAKRELFKNDNDIIYKIKHIIGINGISNVVNRPDLLDRALLIETKRIPDVERREEEEINKIFDSIKPEILGNCFDILSEAMKIKPTIQLDGLTRMADFSRWGCAIAETMSIGKDQFLLAYKNNTEKQNDEAINASPIGYTIIELMKKENTGILNEQPTQILNRLKIEAEILGLETTYDRFWPKDPKQLWKKISEIAPVLKTQGIEIIKGRGANRFIEIKDIKRYESYSKEIAECQKMASTLFK